jgi:hypothetical protein
MPAKLTVRCTIPLPGNVSCPYEAIYLVTSSKADLTYRRSACVFHLVAAIDLDMRTRAGVSVTMTNFEALERE